MLFGLAALLATPAHAQTPAEFYRGKTVTFIVGAAPGGAYDAVTRVIVRHMPRHIPGQPQMVMSHMAGAASLVLTNYLYNRAQRDGTVLGMPNNSIPLEPRTQLLSRAGGAVQFDLARLNWIGSPTQDPQALFIWHTAPATTLEGLRTTKVLLGSTGPGADNYVLPTLANAMLGTRLELVTGYPGQSSIFLAMERGEVHGNSNSYSNALSLKPEWLRDNLVRFPMQFGFERLAQINQVPTAIELAASEGDRALLRFFATKFKVARPIAMPPEVPADRVAAMRAAFEATMKDAQFLDEARRIGLDILPVTGAETVRLLKEIEDTPQAVVDRFKALLGP